MCTSVCVHGVCNMYMYDSIYVHIDVCLSMSSVSSKLSVFGFEFVFVWYYTCSN